jgi:hypothetical protein
MPELRPRLSNLRAGPSLSMRAPPALMESPITPSEERKGKKKEKVDKKEKDRGKEAEKEAKKVGKPDKHKIGKVARGTA